MEEKNTLKEPLLHLIGYCLNEEPIGGMTYSEMKNYLKSAYEKASDFVTEKWTDWETKHPDWKTEIKDGSEELMNTTIQCLKDEKEQMKQKITSYYYENRQQKKEDETS